MEQRQLDEAVMDWKKLDHGDDMEPFRRDLWRIQHCEQNPKKAIVDLNYKLRDAQLLPVGMWVVGATASDIVVKNATENNFFDGGWTGVGVLRRQGDMVSERYAQLRKADGRLLDVGFASAKELNDAAATELRQRHHPALFEPNFAESGADARELWYGDCWFDAVLNDLKALKPGALKDVVRENGDGTYTVKFKPYSIHGPKPDKVVDVQSSTVKVPELTDAELDTFTRSGSGAWATVIEKALRKRSGHSLSYQGQTASLAMKLLAGGSVVAMNNSDVAKPSVRDGYGGRDDGTQPVQKWVNDSDCQSITEPALQFERRTAEAVSAGMLVVADTPYDRQIVDARGHRLNLVANHSYSVLKFDAQQQELTLRNPWMGNPLRLRNGTAIHQKDGGEFTLTLKQFGSLFGDAQLGTLG